MIRGWLDSRNSFVFSWPRTPVDRSRSIRRWCRYRSPGSCSREHSQGPFLTHQFSNGGRSKHANLIYQSEIPLPSSVFIHYIDATLVNCYCLVLPPTTVQKMRQNWSFKCPCLQGLSTQSSMLVSQLCPVNPGTQLQSYPSSHRQITQGNWKYQVRQHL